MYHRILAGLQKRIFLTTGEIWQTHNFMDTIMFHLQGNSK